MEIQKLNFRRAKGIAWKGLEEIKLNGKIMELCFS